MAHCPAVGVNVYVIVPNAAVLMVDGDHVPLIPLLEVAGKVPGVALWQYGPKELNVGFTTVFTVIVNPDVVAHCPAAGVNVYVVVFVLSSAGDHVPVIPLSEVVGKAVNVPPAHIGAIAVNVGVTIGFTTIVSVVEIAHPPLAGVKV